MIRGSVMKQTLLNAFLMLYLLLPAVVYSGEMREIVLVDNSVILGELISLDNGIYKIKTATLGNLEVKEDNIKTIRSGPSVMTGNVTAPGQQEILAMQQRMMADGNILQQILNLENDPDFQEIFQDEVVMQAINAGDLNALMTNPKIIKLMEKSSVQEINMNLE